MATIRKFEEVLSWIEARELNKVVGKLIKGNNFEKNFRLINQIEGSAGSIMDNIAEGFDRNGNKEFIQFLYIAKASCAEFRSQLYRAVDRDYLRDEEFKNLYDHALRISSLIQALINYLKDSELTGSKFKTIKNASNL